MDKRQTDIGEPARRIPSRIPAVLDGLTSVREVTRAMVQSGMNVVFVEVPAGPVGMVTMTDVIEAVAAGADPDLVWAGDVMRPAPIMVNDTQDPADVAEHMVTYDLDVVALVGDSSLMGVASPLDVLRAMVRFVRESESVCEAD